MHDSEKDFPMEFNEKNHQKQTNNKLCIQIYGDTLIGTIFFCGGLCSCTIQYIGSNIILQII